MVLAPKSKRTNTMKINHETDCVVASPCGTKAIIMQSDVGLTNGMWFGCRENESTTDCFRNKAALIQGIFDGSVDFDFPNAP